MMIALSVALDNPCRNVKTIRTPTTERPIFTPDEAVAFLSALDDAPEQYKTLFMLAVYGGFRRVEMLGFEWSDVDFDNRIITVNRTSIYDNDGVTTGTPKTKTSQRSLKLPEIVFQQLREHRTEQLKNRLKLGDAWIDSDRIFTSWNGAPMGETTANHWLQRFCKNHNLPVVCVHSLRHLNATLLISSGADRKTVASALGHSDPSFTERQYVQAFQEQQAKASEAVADVLTLSKRA